MPNPAPNSLKKHDFLVKIARLWTRQEHDAFDLIHFTETDDGLQTPDNWNSIAAEVLAEEIAAVSIPADGKAVEENTVPSWLWRHIGVGKASAHETSTQQIFNRIVGAAAYKAWKSDLFADEVQARNFYDEARYALAQRFIALDPKLAAKLGHDWAYGLKSAQSNVATKKMSDVALSNRAIDELVSGHTQTKLHKLLAPKATQTKLAVRFSDIAADWEMGAETTYCSAALNLMSFRHNDGSLNIDALRHATKLLVTLLDLHDAPVAIGFINLAPLLMALALPYDSDGARNLAAAISALITAETYATSAELAALRGVSADFTHHRENILRNLRNHRRAVYGDRNDYEKLSVLPAPLDIKKSPDLALVAAAQRRWDEALDLVRACGLRHSLVTALSLSPALGLFMESSIQALAPVQSLTMLNMEDGTFNRTLAPIVTEALVRLIYDQRSISHITNHIMGNGTLTQAPYVNHTELKARGFTTAALEALEDYLPNVSDIRVAFTPWVLGETFCRKILKISAQKLQNPGFDLLAHLGFTADAVTAANNYCYGFGTVKGAKDLKPQHAAVFAQQGEVSPEAHIRMAAAVQSFVSFAIDAHVSIAADAPVETKEKLLLNAWQQGLRGVTIDYLDTMTKAVGKKTKHSMSAFLHTRPSPALPTRRMKSKVSRDMVSMKPAAAKTTGKSRSK